MLLRAGDNDRASRCDEFVNPQFAQLEGCTSPFRGEGAVDAWMSRFDSVRGGLAAAALGYGVGDRFRVELALSARNAAYEQSSPILDLDGVAFTRTFGSELPQANERVEGVRSVDAFANAYFVLPNASRFTPYVGVGVGVGAARLEYAALWQRSADPNTVESARGLPNEDEVRAQPCRHGEPSWRHFARHVARLPASCRHRTRAERATDASAARPLGEAAAFRRRRQLP